MNQHSPEWYAARAGKVTASHVFDVMAKTKTGPAAGRKNYLYELLIQRLTGDIAPSYSNAAMERGIEKEPLARELYALQSFDEVTEAGFITHPTIANFGASPDGLVNDDGLLEIKCPNTATHIQTLKSEKPENKYILQMQSQMMCTGRKWCDFVSFDDRLPQEYSFFTTRIFFDQELAQQIENEVIIFLAELEKELAELKKLITKAA